MLMFVHSFHMLFIAVVTRLTEGLPVVPVPEQGLVATMWLDVIHDLGVITAHGAYRVQP